MVKWLPKILFENPFHSRPVAAAGTVSVFHWISRNDLIATLRTIQYIHTPWICHRFWLFVCCFRLLLLPIMCIQTMNSIVKPALEWIENARHVSNFAAGRRKNSLSNLISFILRALSWLVHNESFISQDNVNFPISWRETAWFDIPV